MSKKQESDSGAHGGAGRRELSPEDKKILELIKDIKSLAIRLKDKSDEIEKTWHFEV